MLTRSVDSGVDFGKHGRTRYCYYLIYREDARSFKVRHQQGVKIVLAVVPFNKELRLQAHELKSKDSETFAALRAR